MQNLLCIGYEKILLLNPVIFRGDYRVMFFLFTQCEELGIEVDFSLGNRVNTVWYFSTILSPIPWLITFSSMKSSI